MARQFPLQPSTRLTFTRAGRIRSTPLLLVICAAIFATSSNATPKGEASFSGNIGVPDALGSDISPLPARFPRGHWERIDDYILGPSLQVSVVVNGHRISAVLDSGAQSTTLSYPVAKALGIRTKGKGVKNARVIDAHGKKMGATRTVARDILFGGRAFENVEVLVVGNAPGMFVIGYELLAAFDLFIAADHGLIGFFPPGESPRLNGSATFDVGGRARRQMYVTGLAPDTSGKQQAIRFLVDTGASQTSIPARIGLERKLKASTAFESRHGSVSGVQRLRGRFVLNPLYLVAEEGEASVGRVLAVGDPAGRSFGLLGLDVIARHHTILSPSTGEIRMSQPALPDGYRTRGPNGVLCTKDGRPTPCLSLALRPLDDGNNDWLPKQAIQDFCLAVDVDKAYRGQTLELAVTAYDQKNHALFVGGALHIFLSIPNEGVSTCLSLYDSLEQLGLEKDAQLSLRFVRAAGFEWPCDPKLTRCMRFTGPAVRVTESKTASRP